ncbi:MAG TPA: DUF58 domain-containing protein [Candidatus Acidoferrales bacterium]|nr:DUF58 domain-containing protein [Candidatus Acidoferrales bacterium]
MPPPLVMTTESAFAPAAMIPGTATAVAENGGRLGAAFGPRFFLFLLAGLVWLGPAWWNAKFLGAMLLWDAFAVVFWGWDLRRLPRAGQLEVTRMWTAPPALRVASEVVLEVTQHGAGPMRVELVDDVPAGLRAAPPRLRMHCLPGQASRANFEVEPVERGDLRLGAVHVRVQSRIGFAERWLRAGLTQTVRVFPDLEEVRRHTFYLQRSRQAELEKRRARLRGYGREFESLREYREGDELRDICWTASARRGNLVTKVHQIERSQAVWLIVDAGRLLRARIRMEGTRAPLEKLDFAATAALTLAFVVLHSGDRVGLLAYGRRVQQRVNAARGARQQRALADALALVRSEVYEADHAMACDALLAMQKRRSLVVWMTDLAETSATPEVIESTLRLVRRHLVLFVVLAQPDVARVGTARPKTSTEMYQAMAAQEMLQRRDVQLGSLRAQGALTVQVDPEHLAPAMLEQYLAIKERSLI